MTPVSFLPCLYLFNQKLPFRISSLLKKRERLDHNLRDGQKGSDHLQDFGITPGGVIESRSVDQCNPSPVELKCRRNLHFICAGLEGMSNSKIRATRKIDELEYCFYEPLKIDSHLRELTLVFPEPVAPITLYSGWIVGESTAWKP